MELVVQKNVSKQLIQEIFNNKQNVGTCFSLKKPVNHVDICVTFLLNMSVFVLIVVAYMIRMYGIYHRLFLPSYNVIDDRFNV